MGSHVVAGGNGPEGARASARERLYLRKGPAPHNLQFSFALIEVVFRCEEKRWGQRRQVEDELH